jgi:hypothetical protein
MVYYIIGYKQYLIRRIIWFIMHIEIGEYFNHEHFPGEKGEIK